MGRPRIDPPASGDRPHILWICTDSQRWDTLGCAGNPWVRTPHLDRLAAQGTRFEHCYAQSPLCTPSRACFLTGRYPSTCRLRQNGQTAPPDLRPVTRLLRDGAGYVCGLSGKLHLSACDRRLSYGPEWWRVDERWWEMPAERRLDDGYDVFEWDHAPSGRNPVSAYTRWLVERGADPGGENGTAVEGSGLVRLGRPDHLHQTTFCVEKALSYIEAHARTRAPWPWLFSVNIFDPHYPFNPPEAFLRPWLERLDALPGPIWEDGELDAKPEHQRRHYLEGKKNSTRGMPPREQRLVQAAYWAMVEHIDHQVGRLLDALDRLGIADRTLVVFTSDHGELLGDHGKFTKGPFLYDGAVRVPLIARWPGRVRQQVCTGLVELGDLAPTLLDAAGLARDPGMQARSLWPVLTGTADGGRIRDDVFAEYQNANPDNPPLWLSMLRTASHKLVAVHGSGTGELYDLAADPRECRNRWDDPTAAAVKCDLLQRLAARQAWTADPLPERIGVF